MLVLLSLDDPDSDVRLAAADALRCLPEAEIDGESAHEKLPGFVSVGPLISIHVSCGEKAAVYLRHTLSCPAALRGVG